jgi:hypothetical protein
MKLRIFFIVLTLVLSVILIALIGVAPKEFALFLASVLMVCGVATILQVTAMLDSRPRNLADMANLSVAPYEGSKDEIWYDAVNNELFVVDRDHKAKELLRRFKDAETQITFIDYID